MKSYVLLLLATNCLAFGAGCSSDCGDLTEDARTLKDELAKCEQGDVCVLVSFEDDCTGALGCGVAANEVNAERAREKLGEIAKESLGCSSCTLTDCPNFTSATCDTEVMRCKPVR